MNTFTTLLSDTSPAPRAPLTRERILLCALELADQRGLDAVSMRQVAQGLRVEAMSLYKYVANKDDLLDGLVEWVVAQMGVASPGADWKLALHERARTIRETLNQHAWAANLIESRTTIGPARLRHNDSMIGILRNAGFTIDLAFHAMIAFTSYVYGFVILEEGNRRKGQVVATQKLEQLLSPNDYPNIFEMIRFAYTQKKSSLLSESSSEPRQFADFEFGLNLLIDGFERVLTGPKLKQRPFDS